MGLTYSKIMFLIWNSSLTWCRVFLLSKTASPTAQAYLRALSWDKPRRCLQTSLRLFPRACLCMPALGLCPCRSANFLIPASSHFSISIIRSYIIILQLLHFGQRWWCSHHSLDMCSLPGSAGRPDWTPRASPSMSHSTKYSTTIWGRRYILFIVWKPSVDTWED